MSKIAIWWPWCILILKLFSKIIHHHTQKYMFSWELIITGISIIKIKEYNMIWYSEMMQTWYRFKVHKPNCKAINFDWGAIKVIKYLWNHAFFLNISIQKQRYYYMEAMILVYGSNDIIIWKQSWFGLKGLRGHKGYRVLMGPFCFKE